MKKFTDLIEKFEQEGVRRENIDYAISAVKEGIKREHILDSLTADYRGMSLGDATVLLDELYAVNGGEFKKENRMGYVYGGFLLLAGIFCIGYLWHFYHRGGVLIYPALIWIVATAGTALGLLILITSFMGKFREQESTYEHDI